MSWCNQPPRPQSIRTACSLRQTVLRRPAARWLTNAGPPGRASRPLNVRVKTVSPEQSSNKVESQHYAMIFQTAAVWVKPFPLSSGKATSIKFNTCLVLEDLTCRQIAWFPPGNVLGTHWTVRRALSASISVRPHWGCCGCREANPCLRKAFTEEQSCSCNMPIKKNKKCNGVYRRFSHPLHGWFMMYAHNLIR